MMRRYIQEHGIQLVHPYDIPTVMFAVLLAKAFGVPVVIASQLSYRGNYLPRERHLLRITGRIADAVVVNSAAVPHMIEDENPALQQYLWGRVTKICSATLADWAEEKHGAGHSDWMGQQGQYGRNEGVCSAVREHRHRRAQGERAALEIL